MEGWLRSGRGGWLFHPICDVTDPNLNARATAGRQITITYAAWGAYDQGGRRVARGKQERGLGPGVDSGDARRTERFARFPNTPVSVVTGPRAIIGIRHGSVGRIRRAGTDVMCMGGRVAACLDTVVQMN